MKYGSRFWCWIVVFVVLMVATLNVWCPKAFMLIADIESSNPQLAEVFFADKTLAGQEEFRAGSSVTFRLSPGRRTYRIELPCETLTDFRLDIGFNPGVAKVSCLKIDDCELPLDGFRFSDDVMEHSIDATGRLALAWVKPDPYMYAATPYRLVDRGRWLKPMYNVVLWVLVMAATAWFLIAMAARFRWKPEVGEGRILAFDAIRALSCAGVVYFHTAVIMSGDQLRGMTEGCAGVSAFIFLSGASLALRSLKRDGGYLAFIRQRLYVLMPPYLLGIVAMHVIAYLTGNGFCYVPKDMMTAAQSITGFQGYLFVNGMTPTYGFVGDWFVGFILLLYLVAPPLYRLLKRFPIVTLASVLVLAYLSCFKLIALAANYIGYPFDCRAAVSVRLFEFAFGMAFVMYVRNFPRLYGALATLFALLLTFHHFVPVWVEQFRHVSSDMVEGPMLVVALSYLFESIVWSDAFKGLISFLGRYSYPAFLVHHFLVMLLVDHDAGVGQAGILIVTITILTLSYLIAWILDRPISILRGMMFGDARV